MLPSEHQCHVPVSPQWRCVSAAPWCGVVELSRPALAGPHQPRSPQVWLLSISQCQCHNLARARRAAWAWSAATAHTFSLHTRYSRLRFLVDNKYFLSFEFYFTQYGAGLISIFYIYDIYSLHLCFSFFK